MNIKTYPLITMSIPQALEYQFKLVDIMTKHFSGTEFLNTGSVGVSKSLHTQKVESCLAEFFEVERCILVRGAGTGAIRWGLFAIIPSGGTILIHDAPIYPTTETSFQMMNLNIIRCNFNDFNEVQATLQQYPIDAVHIQLTRQKPDDSYQIQALITAIRQVAPTIPISCDDNYGAMKVPYISAKLGADLCSFSLFKLLGVEGIACIAGKATLIQKIQDVQYSGGSQVQGHEAMECLRSLVYTPVMLAQQSTVVDQLAEILNSGEFPFIKQAFVANAQSKVLLVELKENIAPQLLIQAEKLGALPYPVGAESRYDTLPLFYKVSGTFLQKNPELANTMIRINPNKSGINTIIHILSQAYILVTNKEQ
ncbi:MAG: aminotransferase class V-fold PLP-dependent enzyme [Brevinema sp.]